MHKEKQKEKNVSHIKNDANRNNKQQLGRAKQNRKEQRDAWTNNNPRGLSMLVNVTYLLYTHPILFSGVLFVLFVLFDGVIPLTWFSTSLMNSLSSYLLLRVFFPW